MIFVINYQSPRITCDKDDNSYSCAIFTFIIVSLKENDEIVN